MRISNREMAVLALILIFISFANIFPFKTKVMGKAGDTASAMITVRVIGFSPNITSYYPLTNVTITEEQNQTFNVSFTDIDDSDLDVTWILYDKGHLSQTIVKQDPDVELTPGGRSNYTFVANYSSAGDYEVLVFVEDGYYTAILLWILNVTNVNRPPYFHTDIQDMSWNQGLSHTMDSLDNYATDPDLAIDDDLFYDVFFAEPPSNIQAEIQEPTNEVKFIATRTTFTGSEVVYFRVTDSEGAFDHSNNVTLTIKPRPTPIPPVIPSGGGGGGRTSDERCENYWYCGAWGPCDPITSTRERECIDLALCPVGRNKPKEIMDCVYIPTCEDKIKNGDELGVDCGGPCPSCWSCFDGIKNQDEEGIDCGGPCMSCPTCYDDKRNCQRLDQENVLCETGVDCGGPCSSQDCCENDYWDDNLGEQGIDCGGDCGMCELLAPLGIMAEIIYLIITIIIVVLVYIFILKKYIEKKAPSGIEEGIAIKELRKLAQHINAIEKTINSIPANKLTKLLSNITSKIIHYRFDVDLSCTEKEILEKLSKVKRDKKIKNKLANMHSRLYHLKFSGEELSKGEPLQIIKELGVINNLTIEKLYSQQKRKKEKPKDKKKSKKHKVIHIVFMILTITMIVALFTIPKAVIPKSAPISGFAVHETTIQERGLLTRFVDWLIMKVKTVGRANAVPPLFIGLTNYQVLTSIEDNHSSWLIRADEVDKEYPLSFSFLDEPATGQFILPLLQIEGIVINNETSVWINFTPTEEYVYDSNKVMDNYSVTIVVEDNSGLSSTVLLVFNITNINDPPDIPDYSPGLIASVEENATINFSFNNNTADPDLIHPGYDSITNIKWYFNGTDTGNDNNDTWTYTPTFCDNGTYNVTAVVTDSYGLEGNRTWELRVTDLINPPINNKSFVGYDYLNWTEGPNVPTYDIILEQFFKDVTAFRCSKPSNLTYGYETVSVYSLNGLDTELIITINSNSTITITPNPDWFGVQVIRFYAYNGDWGYSNITITFNVTNVPDIPVLDTILPQYLIIGALYTYPVDATDADNDPLYFYDNATIFDINESTGIISFIPRLPEGTYSVEISVNDSMFTVSQVVNFTIELANYPPNITMISPYGTPLSNTNVYAFNYTTLFPGNITSINVTENTTLQFDHQSTDPESDTLTCRWYLNGIEKKSNPCTISYWDYDVDFFQQGINDITLVVDDGFLNTDTFTWNVSVKNINRPPTFGEIILSSYSDFSSGTIYQTSIDSVSGDITLEGTGLYYTNGTYTSPIIDLEGHPDRTNIKSIKWKESRPPVTNITFKVRTSDIANMSSANWGNIYYDPSGNNIIDSIGRYIQFEINMTTKDMYETPKVEEVTINYEIRSMEITGNYQAWIDLDDFFDDKDMTGLNYKYEDIFGASILGLVIEQGSNIVGLYPTSSETATFRFVANDSEYVVYSNNITLDVNLETPPETEIVITIPSKSSSQRKKILIPVPVISYEQLIYVEPLEVASNKTIIAPIILRNTGKESLTDVYLSARTDLAGVSFRFEKDYISSIGINENVRINLYIQPPNIINASYTIEVIARSTYPELEDIYTININPLENMTDKINMVRDILQLNPICRELEEVVVQAQQAIQNNRYAEADALLTEVIEGCKFMVSLSAEQLTPKEPFILRRKGVLIALIILLTLLSLMYFVPRIINRTKTKKYKRKKRG